MQYKGRVVFEGYAIDNILVYDENRNLNINTSIDDTDEYSRFIYARRETAKSYDQLYADSLKRLGKEKADLFQTYKLMVEDFDLEELVRSNINEGQKAEEAIKNACKYLSEAFLALNDEYMKQRASDIIEVGRNVINVLTGNNKSVDLTKPTILICSDLSVSALMRFNRTYLKGLVLLHSSINSHVAIFARTLGLPTICNVDHFTFKFTPTLNGKKAILDAIHGYLIIDPTTKDIEKYNLIKNEFEEENKTLKNFIGKKSVTKDGVEIKLCSNVTSTFELQGAIDNDAEGIGLFRSESIYLSSKNFPSEDFQFNYYREALEEMKGKEVVIRTFDIGADKRVKYFDLTPEENPALGFRSIRVCRARPEILYTQLRALYRASVYGNLAIMFPMIVSMDEVKFIKDIIKKVKDDLKNEGIKFKDVKLGLMIETPAAAIMSEELAKHADFFSIGTNDLSQYTLACDRLNPLVGDTFDSHHYAIMRLIKITIENAHKAGIPCSMCGELARDIELLPFLAALHIDELSCSSAYILRIRKELSKIDTKKVDINKYINPK